MRLTEGEILSITRERGLEWYLPDFARRIERAVVEKWAAYLDDSGEAGFDGRECLWDEPVPAVLSLVARRMRASLEEKDVAK